MENKKYRIDQAREGDIVIWGGNFRYPSARALVVLQVTEKTIVFGTRSGSSLHHGTRYRRAAYYSAERNGAGVMYIIPKERAVSLEDIQRKMSDIREAREEAVKKAETVYFESIKNIYDAATTD